MQGACRVGGRWTPSLSPLRAGPPPAPGARSGARRRPSTAPSPSSASSPPPSPSSPPPRSPPGSVSTRPPPTASSPPWSTPATSSETPAPACYRLGLKLIELAGLKLNQMDLARHAQPELNALRDGLHLNANLAVLDHSQGDVCHLAFAVRPDVSHTYTLLGRMSVAHCTALGKVLLACRPRAGGAPDHPRSRLALQHREVPPGLPVAGRSARSDRRSGYAVDDGEHRPQRHVRRRSRARSHRRRRRGDQRVRHARAGGRGRRAPRDRRRHRARRRRLRQARTRRFLAPEGRKGERRTSWAESIKLGVIGAGSAQFSLGLVRDLCLQESLYGSTVTFMDVDQARLDTITRLAERYAAGAGRRPALREDDGARAGAARRGLRAQHRARSVGTSPEEAGRRLAAEHGYYRGVRLQTNFKQYALMLSVARDMERWCPHAWLIQSSNPVFEGCTADDPRDVDQGHRPLPRLLRLPPAGRGDRRHPGRGGVGDPRRQPLGLPDPVPPQRRGPLPAARPLDRERGGPLLGRASRARSRRDAALPGGDRPLPPGGADAHRRRLAHLLRVVLPHRSRHQAPLVRPPGWLRLRAGLGQVPRAPRAEHQAHP